MFGKSASRVAPNNSNVQINTRDNFAVVLVDGNGALFREELLRERDGYGAHEASQRIIHAVRENMYGPANRADITVVVRVFADLDELSRIMHESRITYRYGMSTFAEQFSVTRGEFDFVDVGPGKANAARKMTSNLYHFYNNVQCQKIFWVGCHDAGYLKDLQQYTSDPRSRDRIVLVETTPAQPVFRAQLPFPMTKFNHVFRSTRLTGEDSEYNATSDFSISPDYSPTSVNNSPAQSIEMPVLTNVSTSRLAPVKQSTNITLPPWTPVVPGLIETPETLSISQLQIYNSSFGTTSPPYTPSQPTQISFTDIPLEQPQPMPHAQIQEWSNLLTSGNGGISIRYILPSPSLPSYASVGGSNHQNMSMQAVKNARRILLNMDGFRLDDPNFKPDDKSASDSYFDKLQKVKFHSRGFCNYKYLQGECRKGVTCPMEHNVLLSEEELAVHRYRARLGRCSRRAQTQ
ncbi:hypothetical protein N7451_011417 [Penicillium sp. IBT 35674x]|nr:hypothetical protein N7451_011417 [Penicillium sp. IBT 35674x]